MQSKLQCWRSLKFPVIGIRSNAYFISRIYAAMTLYRNSQKRIYLDEAIYFVTFNTRGGLPNFKEEIFCQLFVDNLKICKQLKQFELYAFNLLYNHAHLLLKPGRKYNVSKIIQNLKMNTSRNINKVMGYETHEGANTYSRLHVGKYRKLFIKKYGRNTQLFPQFRWPASLSL